VETYQMIKWSVLGICSHHRRALDVLIGAIIRCHMCQLYTPQWLPLTTVSDTLISLGSFINQKF